MENHMFVMGKLSNITILNGKPLENSIFQWENHGASQLLMRKVLKIRFFSRKIMDHHNL